MDYRLTDCLNNKNANYLNSFFIVQDIGTERLIDELHAIYETGIRSIIVHSGIYEDFCGVHWWNDLRAILEECKRLDMKVWVLDAKWFPSGNAGILKNKYHHLRAWGITEFHMDALGPVKEGSVTLNHLNDSDAEIISVLACKLVANKPQLLSGDIIDITDGISGDMVYFDLPEGVWRIMIIYKTQTGIAERYSHYVNNLIPEGTKIYIDEVFESHYRHFKEYFGNTFEGFFCDEPSFHNNTALGFSVPIGTFGAHYPWDDCVFEELKKTYGDKTNEMLASLWFQFDNDKHILPRKKYMEIISDKYRDNFTNQICDWCRERNIKYVGHIVEDNNIHAETGAAACDYFKALDGMDMAGVDVVLHQIMPGMKEYSTAGYVGYKHMDNKFFNYYLAKLGSSMAHNDPKKKGIALCEIFGAYGWAEGSKIMKYLADHMLVRGINYFIAHMFNSQLDNFATPSMDCPPQFYSGGKNPMYPYFKTLMLYMSRMCHLLNDGKAKINCAIVYDAKGLWTRNKTLPLADIAKILYDNLIDYDIVPIEYSDDVFKKYSLVISCGKIGFDDEEIKKLEKFGTVFADELENLNEIVSIAEKRGLRDVSLEKPNTDLKYLHYIRNDAHYYMLTNESTDKTVNEKIRLSDFSGGKYVIYDAMTNTAECHLSENGEIYVEIEPYNSIIVAFGEIDTTGILVHMPVAEEYSEKLDCEYDISISYHNENSFIPYKKTKKLFNITGRYEKPDFSGHMKYDFELDIKEKGIYTLDLGYVGEMAKLSINDERVGVRFSPPYRFNIGEFLKIGKNQISVDVANNYGFEKKDVFSKYLMFEPSGILGPVVLKKYK